MAVVTKGIPHAASLVLLGVGLGLAFLYTVSPPLAVPLFAVAALLGCFIAPRAILLFLPLGALMRQAAHANMPLSDGWTILVFALLGIAFAWLARHRRLARRDWPIMLMLLFATISSATLIAGGEVNPLRQLRALALVGLFLLAAQYMRPRPGLETADPFSRTNLLLVATALTLFTALHAYFNHGFILGARAFLSLRFAEVSPRSFVGVTGALFVAALFVPAPPQTRPLVRLVHLAMFAIVLGALAVAGVRMVMLAVLAALILAGALFHLPRLLFALRLSRQILLPLLILLAATILFVFAEHLLPAARLGRDITLQDNVRLRIWADLLASMGPMEWALGSGIGTDSQITGGTYVHSFHMGFLFVFGLPAFLALVSLILRDLWVHGVVRPAPGAVAVIFYCLLAYSSAGDADWPDFYFSYLLAYAVAFRPRQAPD